MEQAKHVYRFGTFRLDATDRLLYRDDQLIPLPPKVFETLLLLVTGGGRVLTKQDLMKQLWPDTFVEEGTLTQYVSVLRKAMGEQGAWIETLPRRGYRLTEPVEEVFTASEELEPNESNDSRPVNERIVPAEPRINWTRVAIGVCALLISTGVISSIYLWNRSAQVLASAPVVRSSKGEAESRLALEEHKLYHNGRAGSDLLRASISNANRAFSMNADSPTATRAIVHIQHSTGRAVEGLLLARRSLDAHPGNLDAIEAAAEAHFRTGLYDRAVELYQKALDLEPDNNYFRTQLARMHLFQGEYEKGIAALATLPVQEVGPFGMALYAETGQPAKAIEAVKSFSHGVFSAYIGGCVLARAGDHAGANALWREGVNRALDLLSRNENPYVRVWLGTLNAKLGIRDRAVEYADQALAPDRHHPTFLFFASQTYAILGSRREAIGLLREAMDNGFLNVFLLDYHQRPAMAFHALRNDPELRAIRTEMAQRVDELRRAY